MDVCTYEGQDYAINVPSACYVHLILFNHQEYVMTDLILFYLPSSAEVWSQFSDEIRCNDKIHVAVDELGKLTKFLYEEWRAADVQ